ncbi:hypothetical protein D9619_005049 [Psilocybe cf. subviscida]|uniref:Uncharacterized protein n=1 Tax=Psilocybe cf. subviscida TaxID=2480587 RepID=A0A8H5BPF2_9AGAR|nr:hypothetical protein D9619_005049 [Psilocybe cf. subviscida]
MPMTINRTSSSTVALKHWLSLSRSAPLDISLETTERHDDTFKEASSAHAVAMLHVLANEAHRWRSAALDMDPHLCGVFVDMLLNQFNPGSLPNLKRLEVFALHDGGIKAPVKSLARAIGKITSLAELYLILNPDDNMPFILRDIPWGQLTTVYLGMPLTVHQAAFFLAHSTAAVTAIFRCIYDTPVSISNAQRSVLPKLINMTLNGTEGLLTIFDRFDFPCLEDLTVGLHSLTCVKPLERLMEGSRLSIRRFALHVTTRLSGSELAKYLHVQELRQIPHVEFGNSDILRIAAEAVVHLKKDIPILWSWNLRKGKSALVGNLNSTTLMSELRALCRLPHASRSIASIFCSF